MKFKDTVFKLVNTDGKDICFKLDRKSLKPILFSCDNSINRSFTCMLDTGAAVPVWCSSTMQLRKVFPSAEFREDLKSILSGFGNGFQVADVYYIPEIEFNNGEGDFVRFIDFYLPVLEKRTFGADLIFPSLMFENTSILMTSDSESDELEKGLFLLNESLRYKVHYTYRQLSVSEINKIKEVCKNQGINIQTKFIGSGGEFYKILVQAKEGLPEMNAF